MSSSKLLEKCARYKAKGKALDFVEEIYRLNKIIESLRIDIGKDAINLFYKKATRKKSTEANKTRETIINNIIGDSIPQDYYNNDRWASVRDSLFNTVSKMGFDCDSLKCMVKGGRGCKYDFVFRDSHISKNIEFKFNVKSLDKCSQFLQISCDKFTDTSFSELFYDEYYPKLFKVCSGHGKIYPINKKDYMKYVKQNDFDKHPYFRSMKNVGNRVTNFRKEVSEEAIEKYILKIIKNVNLREVNEILKSQLDKEFLLYDMDTAQFYHQVIGPENFRVVSHSPRKTNGKFKRIVFKTRGDYNIEFLLRWKNMNCILYPAWQISLKK